MSGGGGGRSDSPQDPPLTKSQEPDGKISGFPLGVPHFLFPPELLSSPPAQAQPPHPSLAGSAPRARSVTTCSPLGFFAHPGAGSVPTHPPTHVQRGTPIPRSPGPHSTALTSRPAAEPGGCDRRCPSTAEALGGEII